MCLAFTRGGVVGINKYNRGNRLNVLQRRVLMTWSVSGLQDKRGGWKGDRLQSLVIVFLRSGVIIDSQSLTQRSA